MGDPRAGREASLGRTFALDQLPTGIVSDPASPELWVRSMEERQTSSLQFERTRRAGVRYAREELANRPW